MPREVPQQAHMQQNLSLERVPEPSGGPAVPGRPDTASHDKNGEPYRHLLGYS